MLVPPVLVDIMASLMKIVTVAFAASLAACSASQEAAAPRPISGVTDPNALSAKGARSAEPIRSTDTPAEPRTTKPINIDAGKKLQVVDVYVDMRDPQGMRKLAPYLLRSEEWMILKVEYTTATTRHYRFQRVTSAGESIPMPDPLAPRQGS